VLDGDRAQATAPPDVSGRLRLTAQAEADACQQSAAAEAEHDPVQAANARALANDMAAEKSMHEAANARYEEWSAKTASTRETAGQAKAELQRRGHQPAAAKVPEPQNTLEWWREFEASVEAADRALARQQRAAIDAGQPWPPVRYPQTKPGAALAPELENSVPGQREVRVLELNHDDERAARLDELQARADEAAERIEAQRAELDASREYTARMEREAQGEPEVELQAQTPDEIEMEL
jgi:hypothetical protein